MKTKRYLCLTACIRTTGIGVALLTTMTATFAQSLDQAKPLTFKRVTASPDGSFEAVSTKRGRVLVRRISDGVVTRTLYACNPTALAFSSDGNMLVSVGTGQSYGNHEEVKVKVWRLTERSPAVEFVIDQPPVHAVAVSAERVVTGSSVGLRCFIIEEQKEAWSVAIDGEISELKFSEDGAEITASFADGTVRTYPVEKQGTRSQFCK